MANHLFTVAKTVIIIFLVFITISCTSMNESLEWKPLDEFELHQTLETGWKGIRGNETLQVTYIKNYKNESHWESRAQTLELPIAFTQTGAFHWNPESVMEWLKNDLNSRQCSSENSKLVEINSNSLIFTWNRIDCDWPTNEEYVRIIIGNWYLWVISYGIRKDLEIEYETIINNLKTAKIVTSKPNK